MNRTALWSTLVALVVGKAVDYVLFIRMARKMENYIWFLTQIAITLVFCIISWSVVAYRLYIQRLPSTRDNRRFLSYKTMAQLGVLDGLGNLFGGMAAPYLPGSFQVVLGQVSILMLMAIAYTMLKTRYKWTHYTGALMIIAAVCINFVPSVTELKTMQWIDMVWIALFMASLFVGALSSIVKERALKQHPLDVWHFNAGIALFQLAFSVATLPSVLVPLPAPAQHQHLSELPVYLWEGMQCFFMGVDSRTNDACSGAMWVFAAFIFFNIAVNILAFVVYRHYSAAMATVASALKLPLSAALFLVPFVAGEALQSSLDRYTYIALALLLIAMPVYQYYPEQSDVQLVYIEIEQELGDFSNKERRTSVRLPRQELLRHDSSADIDLSDSISDVEVSIPHITVKNFGYHSAPAAGDGESSDDSRLSSDDEEQTRRSTVYANALRITHLNTKDEALTYNQSLAGTLSYIAGRVSPLKSPRHWFTAASATSDDDGHFTDVPLSGTDDDTRAET
jgi:hypothetical protein